MSAGQPQPTSTEAVACSTHSSSDLFDSAPRDTHVLSSSASFSSSSSPLLSPACSSPVSSLETNVLVDYAISYLSCSTCGRLDLLEMDLHEPGTYYCTLCLSLKSRLEENGVGGVAKTGTAPSAQDRIIVPVARGELGDKEWPHKAVIDDEDDEDDDADFTSPSQEYLSSSPDSTNRSRAPTASPLASETTGSFNAAHDTIASPAAAGISAHAEALAAVRALAYAPSAPRPRRAHARSKEGGEDRLLRFVFDNDRAALTASLLSSSAPSLESLLTCVLLPRRGAFAELILARDNSLATATITKATLDKTSHTLRAFLCEFVDDTSAVTAALSLLSALTRSIAPAMRWTCLHVMFSAEPCTSNGGGGGGGKDDWEDDVHKASLVAPLVIAAANSQDLALPLENPVDSELGSVKRWAPTRVQNRFDHRGLAPLHLTASIGHAANVKALLRLGNVSLIGGSDDVPLGYNCSALLSCKVDPLLRCQGGFTALHWCCVPISTSKVGHAACARLLLAAAPELFGMTDQDGRTALDWASQYLEDEEIEDRTMINLLRDYQTKHR